MLLLNIIILLVDIFYYSSFLYFCRKENKYYKYYLPSLLVTIIALIFGTNDLLSYLLLVLAFMFGLKYLVRIKTTLYDMFIVFIMLFVKVSLELIPFVIFYMILGNYPTVYVLMIVFKILFILFIKDKLNVFYERLKELWLKNVFKIRYIFICCSYIYVIITALCKLNFM